MKWKLRPPYELGRCSSFSSADPLTYLQSVLPSELRLSFRRSIGDVAKSRAPHDMFSSPGLPIPAVGQMIKPCIGPNSRQVYGSEQDVIFSRFGQ